MAKTITLNLTFCTADKENTFTVDDYSNVTISFTADSGYIFTSPPSCRWGMDNITGEITDPTHATITLDGVDRDLTIYAECEAGGEPPVTQRTITINRTHCTADKDDSFEVDDGSTVIVSFTADSGYIFKSEPYCYWGMDLIRGTISDTTHATITLEGVDRDLTIYAECEEGEEPPVPTPDNGLVFTRVYNPTFSQLKEAANKLFIKISTAQPVNLQQYVISLHKLMIPLSTNEAEEPICFGDYNTGVPSKVINQTEVKLSCGKVTVPEKWHNALDYSPYTSVRIWLPFLGFFDLSINELMRDEIELTYTIDVLSGKALAEIWHEDTVIYRFVGMAKFEEPYYVEAGNDITQSYLNGGYNMADYTPYLLLDRPQNLTPTDTALHGQPTYRIVTIGECSGYIRCSQVFASGMTATDEEKQEIESLLKTGVLVD